MKWDLSADSISQATTRTTNPAPTQRPQWRTGTALMTSGSAGLTLRPWSAAVERRRLEGPAGDVPLLQDAVIGPVGDDRPQCRSQGVSQLRLFLGNGDAALADLEAGRAHDLEVVAASRDLLVVGGHREVLEVGDGPARLDLLEGVGVLLEGEDVDLGLADGGALVLLGGEDVGLLDRPLLHGHGLAAQVLERVDVLRVALLAEDRRAGPEVVDEVDTLPPPLGSVVHRRHDDVESARAQSEDDAGEIGVVDEPELHPQLGAQGVGNVDVEALGDLGVLLEELDRGVLDVGADPNCARVLNGFGQLLPQVGQATAGLVAPTATTRRQRQ